MCLDDSNRRNGARRGTEAKYGILPLGVIQVLTQTQSAEFLECRLSNGPVCWELKCVTCLTIYAST